MSLKLENHLFRVLERRAKLEDYLGEYHWGLCLEEGILLFTAAATGKPLTVRSVQVLGSEDAAGERWRWAWAERGVEIPPRALAGIRKVREEGERTGERLFIEPETAIEDPRLGTELAIRCTGYLDLFTFYLCPCDERTYYVAVEQDPEPGQKGRRGWQAVRAVQTGVSLFNFVHREAVLSYLGPPAAQYGSEATWEVGRGEVKLSFDTDGAIAGLFLLGDAPGEAPEPEDKKRGGWWRFWRP